MHGAPLDFLLRTDDPWRQLSSQLCARARVSGLVFSMCLGVAFLSRDVGGAAATITITGSRSGLKVSHGDQGSMSVWLSSPYPATYNVSNRASAAP